MCANEDVGSIKSRIDHPGRYGVSFVRVERVGCVRLNELSK